MKKFIFAFAAVLLLASAQFAFAAEPSTSLPFSVVASSHPVYGGASGMEIVGYVSDIDWNAAAAEQLRYAGLPIIKANETAKDETGIEYNCSNAGTSFHNCVSLVGEAYYRNNMIKMVKNLSSLGILNGFPRFFGWAKIAGVK